MRNEHRTQQTSGRILMWATVLFTCWGPSFAQAREYDPYIMYVFPAGGQKGTTVECMTRGRGLEGASEVRISGGGVAAKVIAVEQPSSRLQQRSANRQDQSENPNVVRFSVTIAADAEPGARDLWVITPKGPSNRFKFLVGQIPEVREVDENQENDKLDTAQALETLPILINGQVDQADRDIFRFSAKAGQTIVCKMQGQSILPYIADAVPGWLQACMTLYDSTGKVLVYVDDWRFRPDPVIVYQVPQDGDYLVEVKDVLFRGREDLVYRLSVGELPFLTHLYPLGGHRDSDAQVELFGANLPTASTSFAIPGDAPPLREVKVNGGGLVTNSLPFAAGDDPEIHEAEPNDAFDQANKIELPVTINGRIQQAGDADYFTFNAKAKDVVVVDVQGRRLESPIDPIIALLTAKGSLVVENDDTVDASQGLITHHADSYLLYTIRTDGDYVVRIEDVQGVGGEEYAYRIRVTPPRPDFDLRVFPANLSVPKGGSAAAKIKAYRRDGFNGEIHVSAAGLPAGLVASDIVIAAGQKETPFTITAAPETQPGIASPTFTGRAQLGDKELVRAVTPAEDLMQAFYYRHDVPTDEMLVKAVDPITVTLSTDKPVTEVSEIVHGKSLSVVVKASRAGLKTAVVRAEAEKQATAAALAKVKEQVAKSRTDYDAAEKAAREAASAVAKAAPAEKAAATKAAADKRKAADAARLKRDRMPTAERAAATKATAAAKRVDAIKKAEQGAISLKAETLPKGVTVKAASIPAGQNEATITITVNTQAPAGFRQNIMLTASVRAGQETFTGAVPAIPIKVVAPPK